MAWHCLLHLFERPAEYSFSKNQTRVSVPCPMVKVTENNNSLYLSLRSSHKRDKATSSFLPYKAPGVIPSVTCGAICLARYVYLLGYIYFFNFICTYFACWIISLIPDKRLFLSNLVLSYTSLCLVNFVPAFLSHAKQQLASSQLSLLLTVTIPSPASFSLIFLL